VRVSVLFDAFVQKCGKLCEMSIYSGRTKAEDMA
jgi:hypothetical protein